MIGRKQLIENETHELAMFIKSHGFDIMGSYTDRNCNHLSLTGLNVFP